MCYSYFEYIFKILNLPNVVLQKLSAVVLYVEPFYNLSAVCIIKIGALVPSITVKYAYRRSIVRI